MIPKEFSYESFERKRFLEKEKCSPLLIDKTSALFPYQCIIACLVLCTYTGYLVLCQDVAVKIVVCFLSNVYVTTILAVSYTILELVTLWTFTAQPYQ
jgi:hypothetical protein